VAKVWGRDALRSASRLNGSSLCAAANSRSDSVQGEGVGHGGHGGQAS